MYTVLNKRRKITGMDTFLLVSCIVFLFFSIQGTDVVFQVNVSVSLAGRARPAPVPSPQRPACQTMAWFAATGESVCVASVYVMTRGDLERSVRSVPSATAPVNLTGNHCYSFVEEHRHWLVTTPVNHIINHSLKIYGSIYPF